MYECPPNGQGVIALLMLNILEGFALDALEPNGAERLHLEAEATRLAYRDRNACLADPAVVDVPVGRLLDKGYAAQLRALIDRERALVELPQPLLPEHRDTVYLTVVDRERNLVSFINSVFDSFGSGLVCPETGVLFHNRGRSFSLDPAHPNVIAPGKRPMHTIIPALAFEGGRPTIGFGVMGGHYQPVGHVHVLTNLVDFGLDPQAALDAPRAFAQDGELRLERGVPRATAEALGAARPQDRPRGQAARRRPDHRDRPCPRRAARRLRPAQGRPRARLLGLYRHPRPWLTCPASRDSAAGERHGQEGCRAPTLAQTRWSPGR